MTEPWFGTESAPEAEVQPEVAAPVPPVDADPQDVAEQAAEAEPPELPDPDWLTEIRNNAPGYLVTALEDVHRRLRNLER